MVPRGVAVVCASLLFLLAGCSDAPAPEQTTEAPESTLSGIVVTEAIVPVEGATVSLPSEEMEATTDADGRFTLGPLPPGTYRLTVRAGGYADAVVAATVRGPDDGLVNIVLAAVSRDVPYHETIQFQGYLECTLDTWVAPYQVIGAPCFGLVDLVTGVTVSWDEWQFVWEVDNPGLEGVLIEMIWEEQATGSRMGLLLRNVAGAGSGVDAGGTNVDTQYFSTHSESPMRAWVHQGVENPGADDGAVFQEDPDAPAEYKILILGRADYDQPADVHLTFQLQPEIFLTKFHHALGGEDFSVLG